MSGLPAGFSAVTWAESAGINNGLPYLIGDSVAGLTAVPPSGSSSGSGSGSASQQSAATQGQLQSQPQGGPITTTSTTADTGATEGTNPPPASSSPATPPTSGSPSTGGLGSLDDLNLGGQDFNTISPNSGTGVTEPIEQIPPVTPVAHAFPVPQTSDEALGGSGSRLFESKTLAVRPNGVNGIDNGNASSGGNPALWYRGQLS